MGKRAGLWLWCGVFLIGAVALHAQENAATPSGEEYVRSHYTKHEYRIPMRDGVRLFTSVYVPKDHSQPWPIMMDRTPYSVAPYGEDAYPKALGPSEEFEKAGYIFVYQDVRGRNESEGKFVEMRPHIDHKSGPQDVDDSSDTADTIDFLLKHVPENNGKVGIWGISYPGFYTSASIIDSHPAIKAASPQAPMTNLFEGDDAYHGGAFMLAANFGFYSSFFKLQNNPTLPPKDFTMFDMGTPDGYAFFLNAGPTENLETVYLKNQNPLFADQLNHDTEDSYWQARDLSRHMHNIHCAVMTVGGWFDAEDLSGPWRTYRAIEKDNPGTPNTIVEGPWVHGGWARTEGDRLGDVEFNAKTSEFFRKEIQFPFFEYYLKGKGQTPRKRTCLKQAPTCGISTISGRPRVQAQRCYISIPAAGSPLKRLRVAGRNSMSMSAIRRTRFPSWSTRPIPCHSAIWWMISAGPRGVPMSSPTRPIRSQKMSPSPGPSRRSSKSLRRVRTPISS